MRRSQAGMLAFLVLAAAGVIALALLPGEPRGDPADIAAEPAAASALEHALCVEDSVHAAAAASDALEPRTAAARTSAAPSDLFPATGRITGRVLGGRSSREPLAGARVRLRLGLSEPIQAVEAMTDERGQFTCDGLRLGGWFLEVLAHEHQKVSRVARLQPEAPAADIEVLLPMSRELEVRVVDERAQPLTFARIGLAPELAGSVRVGSVRAADVVPGLAPGSTLRSLDNRGERRSEDELVWDLRRALLADARVVLCVGERVAAVARVPEVGDVLQLVVEESTIPLLTRDLEFVVTASGEPVADALVRLGLFYGSAVASSTDGNGRVRIAGVPRARMHLSVVAAGRPEHSSSIDADRVESTHVDLPEPRRVEGLVVADRAAPDASVRIGLWRIHDPAKRLGGPTWSTWSTRAAAFAFADLEPGNYVLAGVGSTRPRGTAADVQRGEVPGAVWLDLRAGDALGVVIAIGDERELDRLPPGKWPGDPQPAGVTRRFKPAR